jgi:hypothetical protein
MVPGRSPETLTHIYMPTRRHTYSNDNFQSHMEEGRFPLELERNNCCSETKYQTGIWGISHFLCFLYCCGTNQTLLVNLTSDYKSHWKACTICQKGLKEIRIWKNTSMYYRQQAISLFSSLNFLVCWC